MQDHQKSKIGLLGVDPESRNYGIRALLCGFRAACADISPGVDIVLVVGSRGRKSTGGSASQAREIVIDFSHKAWRHDHILRLLLAGMALRLPLPSRIKEMILASHPPLSAISRLDLVCSLAAGDSFSDLYGTPNFLFVALPQLLTLVAGKQLIQLPQSYGPFKRSLARSIARFILARSSSVMARERLSIDYLLSIGVGQEIVLSPDVGFLLEPVAPSSVPAPLKRPGKKAGLNINGMLFFEGYGKKGSNPFGLRARYSEIVEDVAETLLSRDGDLELFLFPHVVGTHFQSDERANTVFAETHRARWPGRIHSIPGAYDHREMKYLISGMDLFVGSRMHACIGAISQGVPTLLLGYSDKFLGVMDSIGYAEAIVDLRTTDRGEAVSRVGEFLPRAATMRDSLIARTRNIRAKIAVALGPALEKRVTGASSGSP